MVSNVISVPNVNVAGKKTISILGATGTIGQNTIKLIEADKNSFEVYAVTANKNATELAQAAIKCSAKVAVIAEESAYEKLKKSLQGTGIEVASGEEKISEIAGDASNDLVISGIVGAAALKPTLSAIQAGIDVGLANKEALICTGDLMMQMAEKSGSKILPVDSEHNAIFQCLLGNEEKHIEEVTLTASGGPFRSWSKEQMSTATVKDAVTHPNWTMGAKISVDSATMMNKGLELIEAYHLFGVEKNQLKIIVHPESIIHGLVSFYDGSMLAGLSVPDMCVPLSFALGWPNRMETKTQRLNLAEIGSLNFEQPDVERFPAIKLAHDALQAGGTAPAILNAANEVAVAAFLEEKIKFLNIAEVVEEVLNNTAISAAENIEAALIADKNAREEAFEIINKTGI